MMTINGLQGSLEAYEQRLDERTTTVVEQALKAQMDVKKEKDEVMNKSELS